MASISSTEAQRIIDLAATVGLTRDDLDAYALEHDGRPSFDASARCARMVEAHLVEVAAQQQREAHQAAGGAEWAKLAGAWVVKARTLVPGAFVDVRSRDGRTQTVLIGRIVREADGYVYATTTSL